MARLAPAWLSAWAMAQAMLRLFATPNTTAFFPCMVSIDGANLAGETCQDNTFTTDDTDLMVRRSRSGVDHRHSVAFDQNRCSAVFAVALDPVAEVHFSERHRLSAVGAGDLLRRLRESVSHG